MPNGILTQSFATYKCTTYRRHSTSEIQWNESTTRRYLFSAALSSESHHVTLSRNQKINTNNSAALRRILARVIFGVVRYFYQYKEQLYGLFNVYQGQPSQQILPRRL